MVGDLGRCPWIDLVIPFHQDRYPGFGCEGCRRHPDTENATWGTLELTKGIVVVRLRHQSLEGEVSVREP